MRQLLVELALTQENFFEGNADAARFVGAGNEKRGRLFAAANPPNERAEVPPGNNPTVADNDKCDCRSNNETKQEPKHLRV